MGGMFSTAAQRMRFLVLLSGALLVPMFSGVSRASANSKHRQQASTLYISAPSQVEVDQQYSIAVHGQVPHGEHLYIFFEKNPCLANPYEEAKHYGQADIYIVHHRGKFEVKFNATRVHTGITRVCAYLVAPSIPVSQYSTAGVLARRFKSTRVT
jgi:hypothetical protein